MKTTKARAAARWRMRRWRAANPERAREIDRESKRRQRARERALRIEAELFWGCPIDWRSYGRPKGIVW